MLWMWMAGCAVDGPGRGPANHTATLGAEPDFSETLGRFVGSVGRDRLSGQLFGGYRAEPEPQRRVELFLEGSCRFVEVNPCIGSCGDESCPDPTCALEPGPEWVDVGVMAWGLVNGEIGVEPNEFSSRYYARAVGALDPGPMTLTTDGQVLENPDAPPLAPEGDWAPVLAGWVTDGPVLAWSDPIPGARYRAVGSCGDVELTCEGPDEGVLRLPAVPDDLPWASGCVLDDLYRYHASVRVDDPEFRFETRSANALLVTGD